MVKITRVHTSGCACTIYFTDGFTYRPHARQSPEHLPGRGAARTRGGDMRARHRIVIGSSHPPHNTEAWRWPTQGGRAHTPHHHRHTAHNHSSCRPLVKSFGRLMQDEPPREPTNQVRRIPFFVGGLAASHLALVRVLLAHPPGERAAPLPAAAPSPRPWSRRRLQRRRSMARNLPPLLLLRCCCYAVPLDVTVPLDLMPSVEPVVAREYPRLREHVAPWCSASGSPVAHCLRATRHTRPALPPRSRGTVLPLQQRSPFCGLLLLLLRCATRRLPIAVTLRLCCCCCPNSTLPPSIPAHLIHTASPARIPSTQSARHGSPCHRPRHADQTPQTKSRPLDCPLEAHHLPYPLSYPKSAAASNPCGHLLTS